LSPATRALEHEIVFVDAAIEDRDSLLAGLRPGLRTHLLHNGEPAPRQMARVLRRYGSASVVHVIAHGRPGELCFSAGAISPDNLREHLAEFQ
jgi:hypothetical protein